MTSYYEGDKNFESEQHLVPQETSNQELFPLLHRSKWDNIHQIFYKGHNYYRVVDVIDVLEVSQDPANYWSKMKNRIKSEGFSETRQEMMQSELKSPKDRRLRKHDRDYRALREAGRQPYLTIGPWAHSSPELSFYGIYESLSWLQAVQRGEAKRYRSAPVRVFVTGANEWRDLADWPPPDVVQQRWYLQTDGKLATDLPLASEPDAYRYDPANPTPSLAGPLLTGEALPTDNRELEARSDVLIYTGAALEQDLEVIGPVQADLFVKSSLEHTDFFVRLCDVDQPGTSINVCDALLRLRPSRPLSNADGTRRVTFELWPTSHRFQTGHRLRLQISSGAHPRYARNPGSGEPLTTATKLLIANQWVYHDPDHPSGLVLSIARVSNV